MNNKKILIISMNALSRTQNNGKTIETLFASCAKKNLSHIFFMFEEEDLDFCSNALRFTPYDSLDNFLRIKKREYGEILNSNNNNIQNIDEKKYCKFVASKVKKVKNNMVKSYLAKMDREFVFRYFLTEVSWFPLKWCYSNIKNFINRYKPDVIFYQANRYVFLHKLVLKICKEFSLPLIVQCTDDYTANQMSNSFIYTFLNKYYNYYFKRLMHNTKVLIAISDKMAKEYQEKFLCGTSYVFSNFVERNCAPLNYYELKNEKILLYAGNIGLNRWKNLVTLGKTLDKINLEGQVQYKLVIFSGNKLTNLIQDEFSNINSLEFKGSVNSEELNCEVERADYLIHVESFDEKNKKVTRLSISTKIGEYITSNRCLIAIGPSDVASMEYLQNNHLAVIINSETEMENKIKEVFNSPELSTNYVNACRKEAERRFNKTYLEKVMEEILEITANDSSLMSN